MQDVGTTDPAPTAVANGRAARSHGDLKLPAIDYGGARADVDPLRRGLRRRAASRRSCRGGCGTRSSWCWRCVAPGGGAGRGDRACAAPGSVTVGGAVAVDGPTLFLQGAILVLGAVSLLLIGERSMETAARSSRRPRSRSAREKDLRQAGRRARRHRGLPADHFRPRRHAAVRRRERPADHVHRAGGLLAAAVPAVRAGPAPAAAQPGGGAQVLPARLVRLGVLPVRRGAGLRLRRRRSQLRATIARRGRPRPASAAHGAALRRPRAARDRPALQGARPRRSTSGRRTSTRARRRRSPRFMAACTKVAAFGALLRVLYVGVRRGRAGTSGRCSA